MGTSAVDLSVLDGVRAVECAWGVAAAFCGHALAELGADVVSIRGADAPSGEVSALGALKRHVRADLRTPEGVRDVERLVARADVFIEERAPLGWPAGDPLGPRLAACQPALLSVCLSPFGLTGPRAEASAYPLNVYHASGYAQQIPRDALWPEYLVRPPVQAGGRWGEAQAGLLAAVATVACLIRADGPAGGVIDCSKQDALVSMNWTEIVRYLNEGRTVTRLEPWVTFVGGVLPASDGYVQITIMEDHQWRSAMELLGDPEWARAPELSTQPGRLGAWQDVAKRLANETRRHSRTDLYRRGQALGLPIAPVFTLGDVLADESLERRGVWRTVTTPSGEQLRLPRWSTSVRHRAPGAPPRPAAVTPEAGRP
ncbi:MAG: CoA transferase [Candidatus Rokubacteria bacterium]|nr:CoA transferase [Candidatus Rokubacteria bacterium]MBI3106144.1 CoA transferase [Candidatus Rokubacteria bacterium]